MLYPDASVVVSIYVEDKHSERARQWVGTNVSEIAISPWLHVEFNSALALKGRVGLVSPERRLAALGSFERQWLRGIQMLAITPAIYRRAADMINQAAGLRGPDALHLAIADAHEALLVTFDQRQADCGAKIGVKTQLL